MIDHLVLAVPSLDRAVAELRDRWGLPVVPGGHHPRHGTHNALVGLGPRTYLEVLAADPATRPCSARGQRVAAVTRPTLVEVLLSPPPEWPPGDHRPGAPVAGRRVGGDGTELRWTLHPWTTRSGARLPDLIEWHSPHPASGLPRGATLTELTVPAYAGAALRAAGLLEAPLRTATALAAVLRTPAGPLDLRSGDPR